MAYNPGLINYFSTIFYSICNEYELSYYFNWGLANVNNLNKDYEKNIWHNCFISIVSFIIIHLFKIFILPYLFNIIHPNICQFIFKLFFNYHIAQTLDYLPSRDFILVNGIFFSH